ncbi:hypothetical protein EI555_019377, partial [Monodon monoceros]
SDAAQLVWGSPTESRPVPGTRYPDLLPCNNSGHRPPGAGSGEMAPWPTWTLQSRPSQQGLQTPGRNIENKAVTVELQDSVCDGMLAVAKKTTL